MWYDATVAAGELEAANSPVKGKNGYAPAPVERTRASGWLWSWALAIPRTSNKSDLAWRYIAWATGPHYVQEAGPRIAGGWAAIPPGTRRSTYEIPAVPEGRPRVRQADARRDRVRADRRPGHERSAPATRASNTSAIPQFQDVGNQCTEQFAAVIRARSTIDSALANCENVASAAAVPAGP